MKTENSLSDLNVLAAGKIVHSTSDSYGNILVIDYARYRVMNFDSVLEQSGFNLEKPYFLVHEYTQIMMLVLGFIEPRHVTLLGLGGGSLLRSLHHYLLRCDFHLVELRQMVYEIAMRYFDIPKDARVSITIDDAQLQMSTSIDASTDVIFADMFDAYSVSPLQTQKSFVSNCWRTLTNRGWLVINYHSMPDQQSAFFKNLEDCFSSILVCSGEFGNQVLFACKSSIVDFDHASMRLKNMEMVLKQSFVPLFRRMERITV